ncbi:hypothetical protein NGH44_02610 [Staphylococcus caprae]|uniref:hypothetical protein n=1 Tax=Staphylococcus caprae TaxID=29380 RepID=UPI002DBD8E92|nr:hypothetical protein [Staphylococcus caprae]MEB8094058.1 hypothetical protein [Staphylococcus caprae]
MRLLDDDSKSISHLSYQSLNLNSYYNINGKKMKVIEKRDDTQNGLRAYAFAPVKNGKPDKKHIIMGYAGTDPFSIHDIFTDAQLRFYNNTKKPKINNYYKNLNHTTINKSYNDFSDDNDIVNSTYNVTKEAFKNSFSLQNTLNSPNLLKRKFPITNAYDSSKMVPTQMAESVAFTKAIKEKYPNSHIYGAAHSLGSVHAQMNTVFGNIEGATTFGAPNVNETFSKNYQNKIDSRQFEQTVRNIGHPDDMINNLTFGKDRIGSNIVAFPHINKGLFIPFLDQHSIANYDDFVKGGNIHEMSKSELAQYRKAQKLSLSYKTFGIPMSYNDYIQIMNKKVKDDKDSTTKSKNKSKSSFSKSVNPFSDSMVRIGLGGIGGNGKKIKIHSDKVKNIANQLREKINIYDKLLSKLEEYQRDTAREARQILNRYERELLAGSNEFISPSELEDYMEMLAKGGSAANLRFYDNGLMEDVIQDIKQNQKSLIQFAEKLDEAADQFEDKDKEESDIFGLFS